MNNKKTYKDFESKKSIHFTITRETHSHLRIACFKNRLSLQEIFQEISQRIADGSPDMAKLMKELSQKKKEKIIEKLSETDAESLYNIIEAESPYTHD